MSATGGNCVVAFAGIIGTIGCDRTDVLIRRDLVQQLGKHWGIANIAGGDLNSSDFQCFLVDPYVYLAPYPAFRTAMLAGVPLTFILGFDAGAVDKEVQRAGSTALRKAHVQRSLTAAKGAVVVKSDQP